MSQESPLRMDPNLITHISERLMKRAGSKDHCDLLSLKYLIAISNQGWCQFLKKLFFWNFMIFYLVFVIYLNFFGLFLLFYLVFVIYLNFFVVLFGFCYLFEFFLFFFGYFCCFVWVYFIKYSKFVFMCSESIARQVVNLGAIDLISDLLYCDNVVVIANSLIWMIELLKCCEFLMIKIYQLILKYLYLLE